MTKRIVHLAILIIPGTLASSCSSDPDDTVPDDINFEIPDWTPATHGSEVAPDYAIVFPQHDVRKIEIEMTAATWTAMQADMKSKYRAEFGGGGNGNNGDKLPEPSYFPVALRFEGLDWYKVGFRLKGNSTLNRAWREGIYKLPFRLDFDQFENTYPQINDQRFYGFKELSFSPGARDNSLIREKAGADIFLMAGIPAARTAFYAVYINFGEGSHYCGVYAAVEVIDDTMVADQFGEDDGNIYKPESTLAKFNAGEFEKKNNKEQNDFSDVETFVAALNDPKRNTSPEAWRAKLNQSFNTDHFIHWLAVNTVMLNWDSYGTLAHNYYLYNDPGKGLTWIPWDNNESMTSHDDRPALTISLSGISSSWPLIRHLMDDPVYQSKYRHDVEVFSRTVFTEEKMSALFHSHHTLIAPFVTGPIETELGKYTHLSSPGEFSNSVNVLVQHVISQNEAVTEFLE